jgi:uncharacterized protein (TIGR02246 family)
MDTHTDAAPTISDATIDHTDDVAAISALITDVEAGFNGNDADLMLGSLAENGTVVGVNGALIEGRTAALEISRQVLAGPLRDQRARYELADLTFVRPDVAVGHKRAWVVGPQGDKQDEDAAMIALYVFVKEGDRWWVASRQNTLVT